MSDFLPLELNTESVEIREVGAGWEVNIYTENYGRFAVWVDMSDPLYDQLHEEGVLVREDGKVVSTVE